MLAPKSSKAKQFQESKSFRVGRARAYRPEAFTDSGLGKQIQWGVHIGNRKSSLPFVERFDLTNSELGGNENR